jgi:hypothetical protein
MPFSGTLVRALWHRRGIEAGVLGIRWDPTAGEAAREEGLELRVQVANVTYTWDGIVGNTGPSLGMHVLRSYQPPMSLAATGNQLLVAHGYQEAESSLKMVLTDDPHNGWHVYRLCLVRGGV